MLIGIGVPSLKAFQDNVIHIHETLTALTTETEQTAEKFRRARPELDKTDRYYRFNVEHGLEGIGLEEPKKKKKKIIAVTQHYLKLQDVLKRMQACIDNITNRKCQY